MIPIPSGVRVWIATGHTDMRRGMNGLALQVQQALKRDPHAGDLFVFRGRRGNLVKVLWHDALGMSLYAKRLERGKFIWPSPTDGVVVITPGHRLAAPAAHMAARSCGMILWHSDSPGRFRGHESRDLCSTRRREAAD